MAKTTTRSRKERRVDELVGLTLIATASIALLAVLSYDVRDPTWFNHQAEPLGMHNWIGRVGATVAEVLLQGLGTCALIVPVVLALIGWNRMRGRDLFASSRQALAIVVLGVALASLLDLLFAPIAWGGERFRPGGVVGLYTADALRAVFNTLGALIVSATVVAAMVIVTTRVSFLALMETSASASLALVRGVGGRIGSLWSSRADRTAGVRRRPPPAVRPEPPDDGARPPASKPLPSSRRTEPKILPGLAPASAETAPADGPKLQGVLPLETAGTGYALPPLELLRQPEPQRGESEDDLLERADLLTRKLQEFSIGGSVEAIHPGPVVTTFEFKPDPGVKYSRITSLVNDLCLGLKAESVRIDRIPGKSTVGIEVPNRRQEVIYPKELIGSERFARSSSKLTLAIGKDIGGEVFVTHLDRMPHLLIAGATGAGKSVALNGMIASILYKATPVDVRFIMIDTKMIELGLYAEIPHLLVPVVTDPRHASAALKWAVREMETRYRRLAAVGVRNVTQFNELLEREPDRTMIDERTGEDVPLQRLPYIVIVIDEMADLMMVSSADVEESIMRLAQMARAVGIHLILATQRPSVDVITGTIKANFPSRIAFRVSQRVDSRTIIDQQGAEHLLGRGDMLFLPPGSARLIRLHGGYITEPELNRLITFLKKTAKPSYDPTVLEEPEEDKPGFDDGDRDENFLRAVELVLQEGQCSITLIQRRLRLGYARAARIVDSMERAGIVGPADGAKPREVLVGPEILETLQSGG